jgi:hypothetical protein
VYPVIAALLLAAVPCAATAQSVSITFDASQIGPDRWQYVYDVANVALPDAIEEFTIWFDAALYGNLSIVTPNPPAADWDELVAQPDPIISDDGFYDTLALSGGIAPGTNVAGFAVEFDWLCAGTPGGQPFEIINPDTFQPICAGTTTPEPASLLLLTITGLAIRTPRRRNST